MYLQFYNMYKDVKIMYTYIRIYLLVYAYRLQQQKRNLYVALRQQNNSLL